MRIITDNHLEAEAGDSLTEALRVIRAMTGKLITLTFNDIDLYISSDITDEEVRERYHRIARHRYNAPYVLNDKNI